MNVPPVAAELADQQRRVLWVFRSRHPITEMEMQAAIAEYIRERGEPAPDKRIDVLMRPRPFA